MRTPIHIAVGLFLLIIQVMYIINEKDMLFYMMCALVASFVGHRKYVLRDPSLVNLTYVSRESDSDSKLLRNTLEGRQTFQTCNENQLQFPIKTTYSESTLKYTNTVVCAMYNFF